MINEKASSVCWPPAAERPSASTSTTTIPATPRINKVAITCFMCSSGFINDPAVTDADPVTQAATRDLDGWLFRVFYNSNYEAAVLSS